MRFLMKRKNLVLGTAIAVVIYFAFFFPSAEVFHLSPAISPVAAMGAHSAVVMECGGLWTWGSNSHRQLGDGTTIDRTVPTWIMDDVVTISSGLSSHGFAITSDGDLWGWGSDSAGALGIGGTAWGVADSPWQTHPPFFPLGQPRINDRVTHPVRVMENMVAVSTGPTFSAAIRRNGGLFVWGSDQHPRRWLSRNRNASLNERNERAWRWHSDRRGEHIPRSFILFPQRLMENITDVSAGFSHLVAIDENGTLWGWGRKTSGQIGKCPEFPRRDTNPTFSEGLQIMDDVVAVSAGGWHTAAITTDGGLWTWGNNGFGQLGSGIAQDHGVANPIPTHIMENVIAVSAGEMHTLAITKNGELWAWGRNGNGQLGDGTTTDRNSPVFVLYDVVYVSAGSVHTLAVRSDSSLWAWGCNEFGQLGDGTTTDRHLPVRILERGVKMPRTE